MAAREYGQFDGVTNALELVGERWALLIVRNLLVGPRRYSELAVGLSRIPTNILASRLKELQATGVIRRAPHSRVIVYELTRYGRELEPVILALGAWGLKTLGDPREQQILTGDALAMTLRSAFRAHTAAALPPTSYVARVGVDELTVRVDAEQLQVARGAGAADVAFDTDARILRLISGDLPADDAVSSGAITVRNGDARLIDRFATTFRLAA